MLMPYLWRIWAFLMSAVRRHRNFLSISAHRRVRRTGGRSGGGRKWERPVWFSPVKYRSRKWRKFTKRWTWNWKYSGMVLFVFPGAAAVFCPIILQTENANRTAGSAYRPAGLNIPLWKSRDRGSIFPSRKMSTVLIFSTARIFA